MYLWITYVLTYASNLQTRTCHSQDKVLLSSDNFHDLSTVSIRASACAGSSGFPPCSYGSHFLLNVVVSSIVHCPGLLAPVAPPLATAASRDVGCALAPLTSAGPRSINAKPRQKAGVFWYRWVCMRVSLQCVRVRCVIANSLREQVDERKSESKSERVRARESERARVRTLEGDCMISICGRSTSTHTYANLRVSVRGSLHAEEGCGGDPLCYNTPHQGRGRTHDAVP